MVGRNTNEQRADTSEVSIGVGVGPRGGQGRNTLAEFKLIQSVDLK